MNRFKNEIKGNFTVIPNSFVNDKRLSWKAKGIFLYLASKPNDWQFFMDQIETMATDGKTALQTGIKELQKHGYLIREKSTDEDGQFNGWDWILTIPDMNISRQTENPVVGKSDRRETASLNNTDSTNKETKTKKERKSARVNGCDIPEKLQSVEGLMEKYQFYCQYLKENYNRWPSSTTTETDLNKLQELYQKGNDPIKVIEQTIQGRNKSFYPLRDFDSGKDSGYQQPYEPANASAYNDVTPGMQ